MPQVKVIVEHQMDPDALMARAGTVIAKTVRDFNGRELRIEWRRYSAEFWFKSLAFRIAGRMRVEPGQVVVIFGIPAVATMFKGVVVAAVRRNIEEVIER